MFKKVLLSEDIDTISRGVMTVIDALDIKDVQQTQYCDDAYLKLVKSSKDGELFDLLITDLSFKPDHRKQKLKSGEELIKKIREDFTQLKIIVYSIEDRPERVRSLIKDFKINAYVTKGRQGIRDLEEAIDYVHQGKLYISPELERTMKSKPPVEIVDSDIELLNMLSKGNSQEHISKHFKTINISPNSLSSIEKRLNLLKNHFEAQNAIHLVAIVKDLGLI